MGDPRRRVARALTQLMIDATPDIPGLAALHPDRFDGQPTDQPTDQALRTYRDIYATA